MRTGLRSGVRRAAEAALEIVYSKKEKDHDHYWANHLDCRVVPSVRRGLAAII
jgi:hypothetical protein